MAGGGGGGAPTQQTITQTNIPDWLRPQVETVLGGAMQQLFQTKETPGTYNPETGQTGPSTYEITGVNPFKPFQTSQDQLDIASGAVAGLTPLQQQAMQGAANLRLPGQFGVGTNLAGQAGIGGLFAGSQYANMATDPNSIQSYMSPYMQNVVNVQQQQAQRQADIDRQTMQAQAARAGAFGGGRFGIQQSQSAAELARQKQNIQATGLQNAFQQAQQAQQFGAGLNLQGLGLAGQMAGQMGALGTQELAAQRGILEEQTKAGALEQQQQQNIINQAIQNYAQAQQFPLQQYNAYNALLRGYSIPGQTATTYQAAPSLANQLTGLGTAAYGASKAFGAKEGGTVKMATGGIASLNARVLEDPYEFSPNQIKQGVRNGLISDLIGVPALSQIERFKQQAQAMQAAQQPQQPPIADTLLSEPDAGIGMLEPAQGYAGGGAVAFSGGGLNRTNSAVDALASERQAEDAKLLSRLSPVERLVYNSAKAIDVPAPMNLVKAFNEADEARKKTVLDKIFANPRMGTFVAQYRQEIGAANPVASAPTASAPAQAETQEARDRKQIIEALEAVGWSVAKLGAAGLDVGSMPLRALIGVYNTVARVPRALGVDVPFIDFTRIGIPNTLIDSATPVMDLVRLREAAKENSAYTDPNRPPTFGYTAGLSPALPPYPMGAATTATTAGSTGAATTGAAGSTGAAGARGSGTRTAGTEELLRPDYSLASYTPYTPRPMPAEEKYTPRPMESILAEVEKARTRQLGEEARANAPVYKQFEESIGRQGKRLEGADERNKAMALIAMGLRTAQSTGPLGSAIAAGGIEGLSAYMRGDAANRAAEEKMEEARRSFSLQRLSLEKGDRRAAEQYAQDVRKALIDADRFSQTAAMERNKIALEKYRIGEGARSDAAKLQTQERLGIAGLKLKREQLDAQATKYAFQRGAARMKADTAAAKELADMLKNDVITASKMTSEEKERWKKARADELYRNYLSTMVSDLREEDAEGG